MPAVGLDELTRCLEVRGDQGSPLVGGVPIARLDGRGDSAMGLGPVCAQLRLIGNCADQWVAEAIALSWKELRLDH